jgi:hypothetical protein
MTDECRCGPCFLVLHLFVVEAINNCLGQNKVGLSPGMPLFYIPCMQTLLLLLLTIQLLLVTLSALS